MSNPILLAVITGLATGIASGWLTSSLRIRWSRTATGGSESNIAAGSRNVQGSSGAQVAVSRRGPISMTNVARERPAQLSATIESSAGPGFPKQVLVLTNLGERPVEDLIADAAPDGGAFMLQPNWANFPHRLSAGQRAGVSCVTTGAGIVRLTVSYVEDGSPKGPMLLEALHQ
jgi:hypothetical protein